MKTIIEAMLYNEHILKNEILCTGKWKTFFKEAEKKKIIVFGAGQASKKLVDKFLRGREIYCYLDNDKKKQGEKIEGVLIKAPSDLERDIYNQCVVLITSTVYMHEIAEQLDKIGISNYYSVLAMEAQKLSNKLLVGLIELVLYHILPIQRKKIVFLNRPDRYYCNLKYISQTLHEKYPQYKLVWITNNSCTEYPDFVKCIPNTKLRLLYHVATAKIWLFNDNQHAGIVKRKGQYFINTWHGCVALKKIGIYTDVDSEKSYRDVVETSKKTDLFISNSTWCSEMYRDSFKYCGKILEVGTPRMDILYKDNLEMVNKLKEHFNISASGKVILYAPTFRGKGLIISTEIDMMMIDFELMRKKLSQAYEKEVYILLRLHPAIAAAGKRLKESEGIINVTDYNDVYELIMISDTIITDYSSLMFEASYVGREVFLYATDIEQYIKDRGHYFNYYELPYPIATTEEELIDNMIYVDYEDVKKKVSTFLEKRLKLKETGSASLAVANAISAIIEKGDELIESMV